MRSLVLFGCLMGLPNAVLGDPLLGTKPPEWQVEGWLNSKPLTLKELKGKVVLVRWWTAGGCPFCVATAPALNEFHECYREKGLVVVGFYHHKGALPLQAKEVEQAAAKLKFKFPVATDPQQADGGWPTLQRWWLDKRERPFTSVSFLLDRQGAIRHIHPGGQYVKGDREYEALRAKIEELLLEKRPAQGNNVPQLPPHDGVHNMGAHPS